MLMYYFTTKEELIIQALAAARPDIDLLLSGTSSLGEFRDAAWSMWREVTLGRQRQSMRVLLEVMGLAVVQPSPYRKIATVAIRAWLNPIRDALQRMGLDRDDADRRATLLVSGIRGLCNDFFITRDRARVDPAAAALIESVVMSSQRTRRASG